MSKKRIILSIIGGAVFVVSMILINLPLVLPVRLFACATCVAGAALFVPPFRISNHYLFRVRVLWWIAWGIVLIPVINIFGYLVIDYHHNLPEHLGYQGTMHNAIIFVLCFIVAEIFHRFNKTKYLVTIITGDSLSKRKLLKYSFSPDISKAQKYGTPALLKLKIKVGTDGSIMDAPVVISTTGYKDWDEFYGKWLKDEWQWEKSKSEIEGTVEIKFNPEKK